MGVLGSGQRQAQGHLIQRCHPAVAARQPRLGATAFKHSAAGYLPYAGRWDEPTRYGTFALWNGYTNIMDYMVQGRATISAARGALRVGIVVLQHTDAGVSLHCPYGPASPARRNMSGSDCGRRCSVGASSSSSVERACKTPGKRVR
jgi:hypothetical protein